MYGNDPEPEEPELWDYLEPAQRRPPGCLIMVAIIVIVSLVGTSLSGLAWLWHSRTPASPTPTAVPISPSPSPQAAATDPQSVTAVPTNGSDQGAAFINRIAFVDSDGQIATIAPDGREQRLVSTGRDVFNFPAWSPDGQRVAAIGSSSLGGSIVVMAENEKGTEPARLYSARRAAPFYLYWSPDGQTISFLASDPEGMALHLVPADGSAESRRRTIGGPLYWQWTADSRHLLIHSGFAGEGARLELLEAASDEDGDPIATPGYFQAPGISGDGRILVYAEERARLDSQIVVADTDTGSNQAQRHAGQAAMSLNPDGTLLAYISPEAPDATDFFGPLRLMDVATGQVTLLSRELVTAFFWSPNGRVIAAFVPSLSGGDINVALPAKRVLARPGTQVSLPTFKLIVFDVATGEGKLLLTFTPTITFLTQFLPFFDQYALSHRIWSPDSTALVLPIVEDGRSQIYVIPIHGGPKQFLVEGSMPSWSQQ